MPAICKICEKTFVSRSSLNRHLHKVHKETKKNVVSYNFETFNNKCLENECNTSYKFTSELRYHLENDHEVEMKKELLEFLTIADFEAWLSEVHKKNNVGYLRREMKGKYQIKGQERKRAIKSQGSCKVGHMCTSQIIVVKNENGIFQATYYSTHYGHDTEVQHVRMTKDERVKIASKLAEGITNSKILDSSRSQFYENSLTRLNLLTRNDINNIKYSFKIDTQKTIPHRRASVSDLWNDEWEVEENQQILMIKRQGEEHHQLEKEDFCLIFMNCSQQHMLKKFGSTTIAVDYYNRMTSILVIDEFGEGFPGACMYTNRSDSFVYTLYFQTVASHVGILTPNFFVSDQKLCHYFAWESVMGPVTNHLPCKGHIDRSWQINLSKILNVDMNKGMTAVLKYIRDKTIERIIKLTKGKSTSQTQGIHSRHRKALESEFAHYSYPDTEGSWTLISQSQNHVVTRNVGYNSPCCQLKCSYCNVCVHGYSCTCQDFYVNSTMCCHIHFVVLRISGVSSNNDLEPTQKEIVSSFGRDEVKEHLQTLSNHHENEFEEVPVEIQIIDVSGSDGTVEIDSLNIVPYVIVENMTIKTS